MRFLALLEMTHKRFIAIFLMLLACAASATQVFALGDRAVVTKVIDGDTIRVDSGEKIRLIGVNAPENSKSKKQPYGVEASEYLRKMLTGKTIKIERDIEPQDKYQRELAYIYLENGTFVNMHLVEEGYAKAGYYKPNGRYYPQLKEAQKRAKAAKKGIWAESRNN